MTRQPRNDVLDTLVHAQTAGTAWANLSWPRRAVLRMFGGRFVTYAVAAGHSAHLSAEAGVGPLRSVGSIRASRLFSRTPD